MEKVPGYDCPHGHILYGKCLLCEREGESKETAITPDDQLALVTRQRDALLAVVKAVHYQDYSALPTYREISALIESVESAPQLATKTSRYDELLSALKQIEAACYSWGNSDAACMSGIARNAIAKAKGGAS